MANTRETMGEQACLDALVANTLASFEDDGVTKVGDYGLSKHTNLTDVKFDNCMSVGSYGFSSCNNLEAVDIRGTGRIESSAFSGSGKLRHLVMRGSTKTTLPNMNAFGGVPIVEGDGAVYVQSNLVDTYKADSNWGALTILPVSEYPKSGLPETVTDTWAQIAAASQDGTYSSKYSVGDVKSIAIDGTTYYMQLVAKDADVLASDGTTTVPMTWVMFKRFYTTTHRMNPSNSSGTSGTGSNGGWGNCEMRTWLNDTILPLLPADVQSAIKSVRKHSDYIVPGSSSVTHDQQTSDKLWIPSAREVFGGTSYEQTGPIYSDVFESGAKRTKFYMGAQIGYAGVWWLRSTPPNVASFRCVSNAGSVTTNTANSAYGVTLGFCI